MKSWIRLFLHCRSGGVALRSDLIIVFPTIKVSNRFIQYLEEQGFSLMNIEPSICSNVSGDILMNTIYEKKSSMNARRTTIVGIHKGSHNGITI